MPNRTLIHAWPSRFCVIGALIMFSFSERMSSAENVVDILHRHASAITTQGGNEAKTELTMEEDAILKWTNPVRGNQVGVLYVWTLAGRPEVLGSLITYAQQIKSINWSLQSLSLSPKLARYAGHEVWRLDSGGAKATQFSAVAAGDETENQRLRQRRFIARQFSVQMTDQDSQRSLRLMTSPHSSVCTGTVGDTPNSCSE